VILGELIWLRLCTLMTISPRPPLYTKVTFAEVEFSG
jgi:hypothetical protein